MKKVLMVVMALLVSVGAYAAAVSGNGTVTTDLATEVLTGDYVASQDFTVTLGAVYAGGAAWFKWPRTWTPVEVANIALAGNATEAKKITKEYWLGDTYYKVTITGTALQTVIIDFKGVTLGGTAGAQTFTWLTADAKKGLSDAAEIASQPATYLWPSNNAVAVGTCAITPVLANNDIRPFQAEVIWSVSPVLGGELRWRLVSGTPGYQSTPNPLTITGKKATGNNNDTWLVSTPGVYGTPTCVNNECHAKILAAASPVCGDKTLILIGHPTPAVSVTPWHGTNYAKNMRIDVMANACRSAATETPVAYPTAAYSGNMLFINPTPTVCLTLVVSGEKYLFNTNEAGLTNGKTLYNFGSSIKSYTGTFNPDKAGSYSTTGVVTFKDVNNDGELRSNTTSAIVVYELPVYSNLAQSINSGEINKDFVLEHVASGGAFNVTIFAQAQYVLDADFWSNSAATFSRVVNGSPNTVNAFFIPALATSGSFGSISSPYVIPAETVSRWYNNVAATISVNGILYRVALPAR
jgi:hypothetical protein